MCSFGLNVINLMHDECLVYCKRFFSITIRSIRDETEEESNLKQTQLEYRLHQTAKELEEANDANKTVSEQRYGTDRHRFCHF